MDDSVTVDVQVAWRGDDVPGEQDFRDWVGAVFRHLPVSLPAEISVRVVDEAESRSLNERYRGRDRATNVLSFPAGAAPPIPAGMPRLLGDIVICGPVVTAEAATQGKGTADHWAHLVVHGVLHLLGYDHEACEDAEAMEGLERQILAACGIDDPYAA